MQGERQMFYFMPCFQTSTLIETHTHTHSALQTAMQDKWISINLLSGAGAVLRLSEHELRVHKGSTGDLGFKRGCSKWQKSLAGQFVFSWEPAFEAVGFPLGNKGNQLKLVKEYWPLTLAVKVTWGFYKTCSATACLCLTLDSHY